jgi:hypothetical protein
VGSQFLAYGYERAQATITRLTDTAITNADRLERVGDKRIKEYAVLLY